MPVRMEAGDEEALSSSDQSGRKVDNEGDRLLLISDKSFQRGTK